jgi:hypothetical protein
MDRFQKGTQAEPTNKVKAGISSNFRVQANRYTSTENVYLKTKGAFKIRVQNEGNVGITIFGNFYLPPYADEVFDTGDPSLSFSDDTAVIYDEVFPGDEINILLTAYSRL